MHDGGDVVRAQRLAERVDIGDVALHELAELRRAAMPGRQVVVHDDAVPRAAQRLGRVTADVAGAAGHQDRGQACGAHPRRATSGQWKNT